MRKFKLLTIIITLSLIQLSGIAETVKGNFTLSLNGEVFYPGDTVIVRSDVNLSAVLTKPNGESIVLNFQPRGSAYTAEYKLDKDVLLGVYTVKVLNQTVSFTVDFCSLNATYSDGYIIGYVKTYYTEVGEVKYEIDGQTGYSEVINGNFSIPVPAGRHNVTIKCGSTELELFVNVSFEIIHDGKVYTLLDGKKVNATLYVKAEKEYTFVGEFDPSLVNSSAMEVKAVYKHLEAKKRIVKRDVVVGKLYFPGDIVEVRANFNATKAYVEDPTGRKHEILFNNVDEHFIAHYSLEKDVVLGKWQVFADGIVKNFYVDSYAINASLSTTSYGLRVAGNVSYYFVPPKTLEYSVGTKKGEVELENGTFFFSIPLKAGNYSLTLRCGNAVYERNFTVPKLVEIGDLYFVGDEVRVLTNFYPEKSAFICRNVSTQLNFSMINDTWLATFTANSPGMCTLVADGVRRDVIIDECSINASILNGKVVGKIRCLYSEPKIVEYSAANFTGEVPVKNGTFTITLPELKNVAVKLRYGNAEIMLNVTSPSVRVPDFAFVNRSLEITANFKPSKAYVIFGNSTFNLEFSCVNANCTASFIPRYPGVYTIHVDNKTKDVVVDDYSIEAEFIKSKIAGNVSWHFVTPKSIRYTILPVNLSDEVAVKNGRFCIPLNLSPGSYTAILSAGNTVVELNFTVKALSIPNLAFVNESVEIVLDFKPEVAFVEFKNKTFELVFAQKNGSFVSTFYVREIGVYEITIDGEVRRLIVDDYKIEAEVDGNVVTGNVSWHFFAPSFVEYTLFPQNLTLKTEVKNGSFKFSLPDTTTSVLISCGNAKLELKTKKFSDRRVLKLNVSGRILYFNVSVDKGKFEKLEFDGENVTLKIVKLKPRSLVNVTVNLPFEVPEGMHIYYWKKVDGRILPVEYTFSPDRRSVTFRLQDGVVDEDGEANGVIVDPLVFYVPRFNVVRELDNSSGILHVYDLKGEKLYDVKVEVDRGKLSYLAFVDSANLPFKPAIFPFQLVKFRVDGLKRGEEVEVRITYIPSSSESSWKSTENVQQLPEVADAFDLKPNLEPQLSLKSNSTVYYYKFNPDKLSWEKWEVRMENNTVILKIRDGGEMDEDGKADGVVEDDGGVGWAGYPSGVSGSWGAAIGMDYVGYSDEHTYYAYIPGGDNFTLCVFDGDGLAISVYYPNGTLANSFTANSDGDWDNFTLNTNGEYGWWKIEVYEDDGNIDEGPIDFIIWSLHFNAGQGNLYGLKVEGADEINLKTNQSYEVSGAPFYGTVDDFVVYKYGGLSGIVWEIYNNYAPNTQTYYVFAKSFRLAIYDPDSGVNISVYSPNGNLYGSYAPAGNNVWVTYEIEGEEYGIWEIQITQENPFNDYYATWWWFLWFGFGFGNYMRIAVNDENGLYFKEPEVTSITGRILNDIYPLGSNNGEDAALKNVTVALFEDNGNGVLDAKDELVAMNRTNESGYYSFKVVKDISKTYFVAVDSKTVSDVGLNAGYNSSYIWAEQTYQVDWDGSSWTLAKKFGGRDAEKSDKFGVVFYDDFEEWKGWNGNVQQNNSVSLNGVYSLYKDSVGKGWKLLPYKIGRGFVVEGWLYRTDTGRNIVSLENESWYGYGIRFVHRNNPNNEAIAIDRIDGNTRTELNSTNVEIPENEWYFFRFYVYSNGTLRLEFYNIIDYFKGVPTAIVTATDSMYGKFDRIVIRGKYFNTDDLKVELLNPNYEHYVKVNISNYAEQKIDFGFNFSVIVNTKDADDDEANPRYCQGCLRQFILNSNAITGKQRSYFVMAVDPNSNGEWWTITVNASLGNLPTIEDSVELNGTVLNPDMSVNDSNPNCILYNYSTQRLQEVSCSQTIPVGVGLDGIPFSGDEAELKAIPKPEVEIYGDNSNPILNVTADDCVVSTLSVFGSRFTGSFSDYPGGIRSTGSNNVFIDIFSGLRANGSDPKISGLGRTGGAGFWIEGSNNTVKNSIVAFNERYGLLFYTANVDSGLVENVISYRNGLHFSGGDNVGMENSASNVTIERCVSAKAAANGIESHSAVKGLNVLNCSIEYNGMGNETGYISERAGVRVNCNDSLIKYSLVRYNNGQGVLITNYFYSPPYKKPVSNVTVRFNSIYNNTFIGIDLVDTTDHDTSFVGDNVTLNDGLLNCSQPNCGMDYAVITYAEYNGTHLYVEGFIGNESGSSDFANAIVDIYLVRNSSDGDNLVGNNYSGITPLDNHYGEGWIYLGSLTADSNGEFAGWIEVAGKGVEWRSLVTATATLNGNTSEFGPDYLILRKTVNVTAGITIFWDGSNYNATMNIKAHSTVRFVRVYWFKPDGITVVAANGDFDSSGSVGNYYWWEFNSVAAGETKHVYLQLSASSSRSIAEALNLGVDPHPPVI